MFRFLVMMLILTLTVSCTSVVVKDLKVTREGTEVMIGELKYHNVDEINIRLRVCEIEPE